MHHGPYLPNLVSKKSFRTSASSAVFKQLILFFRVIKAYEGKLTYDQNAFINDALTPNFNTLQSDLYDQSMAEVLGRVLVNFSI